MYLQISTVVTEYLSEKENNWLENADINLFVDIVEGDESQPEAIEMKALTLEQVLEEIVYGQRIVFSENPEVIPSGFAEVKSWWGGEPTFEKVSG